MDGTIDNDGDDDLVAADGSQDSSLDSEKTDDEQDISSTDKDVETSIDG